MPIFFVEKMKEALASLTLSTKNISVFGFKVLKHLMSWPLNELVKLTMLWTTGPWWVCTDHHLKSLTVSSELMLVTKSKWITGPGCSKLMMLLVKVWLNFQKLIFQICLYCFLKKCEKLLHFSSFQQKILVHLVIKS